MHTDPSRAFGDLLKRHRLAAGLSQEELAERAGLSPRGVSDLERGARRSPRPGTVRLLADALALTNDDRAAFLAAAQQNGRLAPDRVAASETHAVAEAPSTAAPPRALPPTGTVTFLFTDIEGSTKLLQRLGPRYADVLDAHRRILRAAFAAHGGYEVDTQGDSFFVAFPTALAGLRAAIEATRALAAYVWPEDATMRVRMGLHSGAPQLAGDRYVGLDVHRAARIAAAGHGGQILLSAATAELARHDLPGGISLRDLGAHRLKDLQQAERVYQAVLVDLPAHFAPLKTLEARPHNLPVQSTPLLGREREVEAISSLLRRSDVRLVTLTGPGGIGKTRLSVQVAAEMLDAFPDGVWNVRLSRLSDPTLVVPTIATTLDLKESGATPLADVLRGHLRDKQMMLVLDNFEQVVAAAPEIADLLAISPGLKVLVTSRVPLHLSGEHEYGLRPLALPDLQHLPPSERLSTYAAVALFIERARAAQADFQVTNATAPAVAEICARLDGLPLAIELAAARVKLLPPPALLKRLERALPVLTGGAQDLDERQHTMRATLEWSYNLLSPEERRLFRRLAVFVGGCTLEAAEGVCAAPEGAEPLHIDMLEGLSRLVDQSLVQQREEEGDPRFGMLYVVREFALEQLETIGEAETLRQAHAKHYVELAERAEPELFGRYAGTWLNRLVQEHVNVRSALGWALENMGTGIGIGIRLAAALADFWSKRGYLSEGREWLECLLALSEQTRAGEAVRVSEVVLCRGYRTAGYVAWRQGDYSAAQMYMEQALELASKAGDRLVAGMALNMLGVIASERGDLASASKRFTESLAVAHELDDMYGVASLTNNLAELDYQRGDFDRAATGYEAALALARELGDASATSVFLANLARVVLRRGETAKALALGREALELAINLGDPLAIAEAIENLIPALAVPERWEQAAHLMGAAAAVHEVIGAPLSRSELEDIEAALTPIRAMVGEERWAPAFAAGRALSLEDAVAEALGEEGV